jgi:2-polyprenyl-3-methyl-5-hydroxy-6-metoxy-1,4-benzoquinol methylase
LQNSWLADFWFGQLQLKHRSEDLEILDAAGVSDETAAQAYRQLAMVNRWLGNTAAVMRLLRNDSLPIRRVLDIGCGQGLLLAEIRRRLGVEVVGIDLRPSPLASLVPIETGNAVTDPLPQADVAICIVMAHHLTEIELIAMIRNAARSSRRFVLLDLVRHPVPLALFRMFLCPILCRINAEDGQTSIRRAYTARELRRIVDTALSGVDRPVRRLRHSVSPLWIRQVVDICWDAV